MKKVSKYIIISLLLLLGLACIGVLYLFFIPNASLFNITYISVNNTETTKEYEIDEVSKIVLNSRSYNVSVVSSPDTDKVFAEVHSNSFGFVLEKNSTTEISTSLKNETLTINVKEPYGFATKNNSYIKLNIPSVKDFDLALTNKSAKTTIESQNIEIKNFSYSTTKGNCALISGTIKGNLDLNLNKSTFEIKNGFKTTSNDISLKLTTGKFLAEHSVLGDINVVGNKRGVIKINECNNFTKLVETAGGQIKINQCHIITVSSSDTDIYVGTTTIGGGININLSKSGSVEIGSSNSVSQIETNEGNITVHNANLTILAITNSGNITINNATATISVISNYGNVVVNFKEDAKSFADSIPNGVQYRVLYAKIHNAKLSATGVEHVGTDGIKVSGNGRVNLNMKNVYGDNIISGKNGSVSIVINKDSSYILETESTTGNVRVNLAQIPEYGGYTNKNKRTTNVNCNSSSNNLIVSTNSGDLTILDTCFA